MDGRTDAQLREDYLKHKSMGLDESKPLPTWPPHEAHQAVDAARPPAPRRMPWCFR